MALIRCHECRNQVSDTAASCPHCGAPIAGASESRAAGANLTTTQLTSKRFKLHAIGALSAFLIGLAMAIAATPEAEGESSAAAGIAGLMMLGGGVWYFVTKLRVWWHHR